MMPELIKHFIQPPPGICLVASIKEDKMNDTTKQMIADAVKAAKQRTYKRCIELCEQVGKEDLKKRGSTAFAHAFAMSASLCRMKIEEEMGK